MKAIKCTGGFQCYECLWVMKVNPERVREFYTVECVNEKCVNSGKKFKFPKTELVELEEL